ncbi:MAG: TonB-dependent receptor [Acidobacteriia bacterium]|nr:TonB-dependent receptor [Terriglobia bacterium]
MKLMRLVVSLLAFFVLLTGQTNRGGISGTVFDPSGSIVPNATVIVTNLGTNQQIKVKTSASDAFTVLSLEPVTYSVAVEAAGFKKTTVDNVKVDTANTAGVNVTLETGAVSTQVTVSAEAAAINTESGTSSTTVNERQIQDVPLLNRSVLDLALSQPNVMGDAGSENPGLTSGSTVPGYNLSINGGRPGSSNLLADGVNNTGVSYGRTMVSFTPETVQEFTVQTSAYSAEYSQTGGGVINVTTKSGTNQLHGTALWYNRNPAFAAAPFTLATVNRSQPTLKYNQFSLSAGGPLVIPKIYDGRNKTFWFAAFEPQYRRDFLAQDSLNPTPAMIAGDFSNTVVTSSGTLPADVAKQFGLASTGDATIYDQYNLVNGNQFVQATAPAAGQTYQPFPGNIIPKSMMDATYLKSVKYIVPGANYYVGANGNVFNLYNPRLLTQDDKRFTLRVDQSLGDKHRLTARFTSTPVIKTQVTPSDPTGASAEYSWAKQAMLIHTWTISSNKLNELRLNYTRGRFSSTTSPEYDPFTGKNLNTELGLPSLLPGGVPSLPFIGGQASTSNNDAEERYTISDVFYWNKGKMSWKFGVDLNHALQNVTPLYGAIGGAYGFNAAQTNSTGGTNATGGNSFASFELGVINTNSGATPGLTIRSVLVPYYYRWNSGAGFVQNDWKVRPNLTFNLGVRYAVQLPRTEKYDHQGVFLPNLAQSYPLSTPLTLTDGEVISSALVPPFGFAGKGGRSRYLYPADYKDFEPRFGFAWSPRFLEQRHVTLRGGYGLSHAPVTGFKRLPIPDFGANSSNYGPTTGQKDPAYVMRLGENPPVLNLLTPDQAIFGTSVPPDGLVYQGSLYYQQGLGGYAVSNNVHTPCQNWNFTVSWQANRTTTVEVAYVGNKGTHLFMPNENINPKDVPLVEAQDAAGVNTAGTINDPLGRLNPATGKLMTVQNGTLGSPFLGFSSLTMLYDASANSIRHAGYVNVIHRVAQGLTFTSNYTYGKSIDDASDSGTEKSVASTGRTDGQVALGGTRKNDRSVSLFDQRHVINGTAIYDWPFGYGRRFLSHTWKPLDYVVGGWTTTGIVRLNSGMPATVTMGDANQLGDLTHTVRPDIVPGVPLLNPLYSSSCPVGAGCQPYLNPSAFMRPSFGQLGTAPRSLDGARGPWADYFDGSIQKNFRIGEKRRLQFRMDLINALNHPVFRVFPNNAGGTDLVGNTPTTGALNAADYDTWAKANSQPLSSTTAGTAQLAQINSMVNAVRSNGTASGVLPVDFFHVRLPANFYGTPASAFDITTMNGFKLFRMRQAYNTAFGDLYSFGQPRYVQFGLKLYF